uniref:Uncharacterized protein n=1 Tax=Avena sativa TaxID=4498 RepID=A0ACD5W1V3_AVESA
MATDLSRDRISNLPDSILLTIISSLEMDEAARCSILSSRWRHLFPSTLLDFNAFITRRDRINLVKAVTSILAAYPDALIRSFRTGTLYFCPEYKAAVDGWLRDLSSHGIEELLLSFNCTEDKLRRIPESLFACSSLKRLDASNAVFPTATEAAAASLACLTTINLSSVKISQDSVHNLLEQCTMLEHVTVNFIGKFDSLRLRSQSLKVLKSTGDFNELFIDDAPKLEYLLGRWMHQRKVHIKVAHAPKLEFLAYLGMSNKIDIGETSFTEESIHVKTLMPSIKTLSVNLSHDGQGFMEVGYMGWLMQLLKLFPRLETLYIKSSSWSGAQDSTSESWEMRRSFRCLDNHLKKVVIEVYRGHEWQREVAKFLHGRSKFLKTMEFHCMDDGTLEGFAKAPSEEWVREQKELLCLDSRAARDASFLFFKGQLVDNHHEVCDGELYQKNYYRDLYDV